MRSGLLTEARHVVLPKGIAATGFPRVRETCRSIGIEFDPWQQDLNKCLLAKTEDGLFAADTAVFSIARQVGKTFDVGAVVFAECIAEPGTTVIWTAHRFKVSRETFNELRALAKSPKLAPHIDYDAITTAAGNECIPFRNGSRIVFAARERGAIRGFTKVRILILDEAQILTDAQLADLAPTMNQAANPLIILMGTPPKPADPSEVFTQLRADALAQHKEFGYSADGVLYVEFSADPATDPDDRAQWRIANPSYPRRTPARSILRLRKLLSTDDFRREALGIWDGSGSGLFDAARWEALADADSKIEGRVYLGIEVAQDHSWTAISAAGRRADGLLHVQTVEYRPGVEWAVGKLAELAKRRKVAICPNTPAGALIEDLENAGVKLAPVSMSEYAQACGAFYQGYLEAGLRHLGQPELNVAVTGARRRTSGDSWVFDRRGAIEISPLAAAAIAARAATQGPPANAARGRVLLIDN